MTRRIKLRYTHAQTTDWYGVIQIVTIKLGVILLCFDVYLSWYRAIISASTSATSSGSDIAGGTAATSSVAANSGAVYGGSMLSEYLHHAALCLTQSLALHVCIRLCAARFLHWHAGNALSTALLISSGARLLPVLMVVFDYGGAGALDGVDLVVALFYNVEAVRILLDCRYWQALALAVVGQAARRTAGVLATVLLGSYHGAGVSLLRAAASVR